MIFIFKIKFKEKYMKKHIYIVIAAMLTALFLSGCKNAGTTSVSEKKSGDKIKIVTSGFIQYDFARNIAGQDADITMLIRPGAEVHTYEPTPEDIIKMSECDVFIYTGGESDEWINGVIKSSGASDAVYVKLMDFCELCKEEDGHDGNYSDADAHNHDGEAEYDEHVWTSPANAVKIAEGITDALCRADEGGAEVYRKNCERYTAELKQLDSDFKEMIDGAARKTIVVGDRFPFAYFAEHYGLEWYAAFPGCASNTEPSAATLAFLINKVISEKIPVVFSIEFSNGKIANSICEASGAKRLELHSCHNVTVSEFENGENYISLMRKNLENLKEALY